MSGCGRATRCCFRRGPTFPARIATTRPSILSPTYLIGGRCDATGSDRAGLFAALLVLMTTSWVEESVAAAACAVLMIAAGCVSAGEARQSIDWSTLVTVAAAFSVGEGLRAFGGRRVRHTRGFA